MLVCFSGSSHSCEAGDGGGLVRGGKRRGTCGGRGRIETVHNLCRRYNLKELVIHDNYVIHYLFSVWYLASQSRELEHMDRLVKD